MRVISPFFTNLLMIKNYVYDSLLGSHIHYENIAWFWKWILNSELYYFSITINNTFVVFQNISLCWKCSFTYFFQIIILSKNRELKSKASWHNRNQLFSNVEFISFCWIWKLVTFLPARWTFFWSSIKGIVASINVIVIKFWTQKSLWNIIPIPGNHYITEHHHFTWWPGSWRDAHLQCWSCLWGSKWTTLQEDPWSVERYTIFCRYVPISLRWDQEVRRV